MKHCSPFGTLPGRALRYLLVLCPFCIALYVLLVRYLLGDCQYLGMLLAWSLQRVVWRRLLGSRLVIRRLAGKVVLVTSLVYRSSLGRR